MMNDQSSQQRLLKYFNCHFMNWMVEAAAGKRQLECSRKALWNEYQNLTNLEQVELKQRHIRQKKKCMFHGSWLVTEIRAPMKARP